MINLIDGFHTTLGPLYQLKGIPHLVILDGDDASVITVDGRMQVLRDKYGLEFPWRPRTIMNMIPKPLRKLIQLQSEKVIVSAKKILEGVLQQLAPSRIFDFVKRKFWQIATFSLEFVKEKILKLLKIEKSPQAKGGGGKVIHESNTALVPDRFQQSVELETMTYDDLQPYIQDPVDQMSMHDNDRNNHTEERGDFDSVSVDSDGMISESG
jgi:hypothetical protein